MARRNDGFLIASVAIDGFPSDVPGELVEEIRAIMGEIAAEVETSAKATSAFADKTGKLRKSIKRFRKKGSRIGWVVAARAPHAHLVEFGTSGPRYPKKKKIMKGDDGTFYGRDVGPMPARPFLRPARDRANMHALDRFK